MKTNIMESKTLIEQADLLIAMLRVAKTDYNKKEKLSIKARDMSWNDYTQKRMQKASSDLNWQGLYLEKSIGRVAILFEYSKFNIDTGDKTYNPSSYHSYRELAISEQNNKKG